MADKNLTLAASNLNREEKCRKRLNDVKIDKKQKNADKSRRIPHGPSICFPEPRVNSQYDSEFPMLTKPDLSNRNVALSDVEEFVYGMVGAYQGIDPGIIRDVLEEFSGDVDKCVESLLKIVDYGDPNLKIDEGNCHQHDLMELMSVFPDLTADQISTAFAENDFSAEKCAAKLVLLSLNQKTSFVSVDKEAEKEKIAEMAKAFPTTEITILAQALEAMNGNFSESYRMLLESGYQECSSYVASRFVSEEANQESGLLQNLSDGHLKKSSRDDSFQEVTRKRNRGDERSTLMADKNPKVNSVDLYHSERVDADGYAKERNQMFQRAASEYKKGNKLVASMLADEGRKLDEVFKRLSSEAGQRIAAKMNEKHSDGLTVDLHFLHVDEAIEILDKGLRQLDQKKGECLLVITGQGKHSAKGQAKVKPAVVKHVRSLGYSCRPHAHLSGAIIVSGQRDFDCQREGAPYRPTLSHFLGESS